MTRRRYWIPGLLAAFLLFGAAVAGGHAVFIGEDGATEFDLSELAEGEVRVFGTADKQVTVERNGEEISILHEKRGEAKTRSFTCRVGRDSCKVLTFENDPEKVMIVLEKTRECHNGVGDCDLSVDVDAIGDDAAHVVVEKLVDCEPDADCAELVDVVIEAAPHHGIHAEAGHNVFLHRIGEDGDHTMLRCPEGDATLRVGTEEAKDTFLCPKHSVPLEPSATPGRIKIIRKGTVDTDD